MSCEQGWPAAIWVMGVLQFIVLLAIFGLLYVIVRRR